jgi:hypothetical protein
MRGGRPVEGSTMKPWLMAGMGVWIIAGMAWHAIAGEVPMPPIEPRIIPHTLLDQSLHLSRIWPGWVDSTLIGYYSYRLITLSR